MIRIGVIGFGYWGPNLVRNFSRFDDCKVKIVADSDEAKLKNVKRYFPGILTTRLVDDIFHDSEIDAVVIATPVSWHYEFSKRALEAGKHVLVEKPMTDSRIKALELVELAQRKRKILMVDHTFLYTGAVKKIKELIDTDTIGDIQYFDSTRINLGLFQHDINVIWDLAPHDLSILRFLIQEEPASISATGISHTENKIENIAYVTVNFQSRMLAHINCSWTSPVKIRKILIGGTRKMIVFDDIEPTEKVKVYDTCFSVTSMEREKILVDYRTGDIYIPKIDQTEALFGMASDFLKSIQTGAEPISNWRIGLSVVSLLEAAEISIKNRGKEVVL